MNKRYVLGALFNFLAIVGFFVPFGILFITRHNLWVTTAETTRISAGVVIGLVYGVLVLKGALKTMTPKLSALISMGIFLAIIYFLDSILNDLFFIVLSLMVGYIIFITLNLIGNRQIEIAKIYNNEGVKIKAREQALNPRPRRTRSTNAIK